MLGNYLFRFLEVVLVIVLASMAIMVFANAVLRYGWNSGINESEELSRFLFIWLTFIGAIVALRNGAHLGMDAVVRRLPPRAHRAVAIVSHLLMLLCCGVFLWGLVLQAPFYFNDEGLVTGISLGLVYGSAYICAAVMGLMLAFRLIALISGRTDPDSLMQAGQVD